MDVKTQRGSVSFYARPGPIASAGALASLYAELPNHVAALVEAVQGLLIHQHVGPSYGVPLSEDRVETVHIRSVERRLEAIMAIDPRPLSQPRSIETRLVSVCSHFSTLLASMLQAKGVPARARCGFGTYFEPGQYVDHWVCEYWNAGEDRWVMVDAQMDVHQRALFRLDFDPLDTPHDRFIIAGEAWSRCRAGRA